MIRRSLLMGAEAQILGHGGIRAVARGGPGHIFDQAVAVPAGVVLQLRILVNALTDAP